MLTVTANELRTLPEGTLFTYDSADTFVRHAVFEKGVDVPMTSARFAVYGKDDLKKLQAQVEFALGLIGHHAPAEEDKPDTCEISRMPGSAIKSDVPDVKPLPDVISAAAVAPAANRRGLCSRAGANDDMVVAAMAVFALNMEDE